MSTLSPGFSCAQSNDEPDRQRRGGNGRRLDRAHPVRDRRQELGGHVEPAGERTLHGAVDALADLESGDAAHPIG